MSDYDILEFTIRDDEYYPTGMNVLLANDKDYQAITDAGDDELIYHYVDDEIDLKKVKIGDILPLDKDFEVLATENDDIRDNESICSGCDKKINDDAETKWDLDADPYCRECFNDKD